MESSRLTGDSIEIEYDTDRTQRRCLVNCKWAAFTTFLIAMGVGLLWMFFHFVIYSG